jgi:hypothetical protein
MSTDAQIGDEAGTGQPELTNLQELQEETPTYQKMDPKDLRLANCSVGDSDKIKEAAGSLPSELVYCAKHPSDRRGDGTPLSTTCLEAKLIGRVVHIRPVQGNEANEVRPPINAVGPSRRSGPVTYCDGSSRFNIEDYKFHVHTKPEPQL